MKRRTRPRQTSNRPRTWAQQKQRDRPRKSTEEMYRSPCDFGVGRLQLR
ncbi:hypothetical protein [Baaleninema simplex]|nr:hypothetical protein [Baaleninema simplex]